MHISLYSLNGDEIPFTRMMPNKQNNTNHHTNKQVDKKIEQLLQRKESITKSMDEQKVSLWELEGHIKKVCLSVGRMLLQRIFFRFFYLSLILDSSFDFN